MRLRIATYNIHRGVGRDGRCRPDRIAAVLKDIDADIVALQEVAVAHGSIGGMLSQLAAATGMTAVEGFTLTEQGGRYGNAVLLRQPPAAVRRLDISVDGREPRGIVDVRDDPRGHRLAVLATHLGLRRSERRRQVRRILAHIDTVAADTLVVAGDFNEWYPYSRALRWMTRRLGIMPAPPTFPAVGAVVAIDRLWVVPASRLVHLAPLRSALTRQASDHLPLVGDLRLPISRQPSLVRPSADGRDGGR